jgi:predicted acyl esterase
MSAVNYAPAIGKRLRGVGAAVAIALVGLAALPGSSARATPASNEYTVQPVHFQVKVGVASQHSCHVVGDVYRPAGATSERPAPAIITTHGFAGSKDAQADIARFYAAQGYVVLTYSGLGFGGSSCRITLDSPSYDGEAVSQLVSFLGGASGIAFSDAAMTKPLAPVGYVRRDSSGVDGHRYKSDPRVGMIGSSYGGGIQFAAASVDHRIDAITPMNSWHDLRYALAPNGVRNPSAASPNEPGAFKLLWGNGLGAAGVVSSLLEISADPGRVRGCPGFTAQVCTAIAQGTTTGTYDPSVMEWLRSISPVANIDRVRTPALILQGEVDTLFNLNEGSANYQRLKRNGVPVAMIWHSSGHSGGTPITGDEDRSALNRRTQYTVGRVNDWLDHYLKDRPLQSSPGFSYYRDWVPTTGNASPAYVDAAQYPLQGSTAFYVNGASLAAHPSPQRSVARFTTAPVGLPSSSSRLDVLGSALPEADAPGTFATWRSAPLASSVAAVGVPTLRLHIRAKSPASALVFARIQDIAPDGTRTTVGRLVTPMRVTGSRGLVEANLAAIAHRFPKGHRVALTVSGGSVNFRGTLEPTPIVITSGTGDEVLQLPTA